MRLGLGPVGRVFSGDKVIQSAFLNALGAQVFRTVAARSIYNLRPVQVSDVVKHKLQILEQDGIVVWPNFLSQAQFERVRQECVALVPHHHEVLNRSSGGNSLHVLHIRKTEPELVPSIHGLLADVRLRQLLEGAERLPLGSLAKYAKIEHLMQGKIEDGHDPQSSHHSDTFFNCHKAWFYVAPVAMRDGPLTFNKGSHKLTPKRLRHIYNDSCTRARQDDPSRRVTPEEMAEIGHPMVLTCPANTLVVANVCGYHSRLQGELGAERWAVQIGLRTDPFRVLPWAKIVRDH